MTGWEGAIISHVFERRQSPTSQVLPVDGNQRLIGLLSVTDDLSDAMLTPQTLNLPVTLGTQVEGVPPLQALVRLAVVVQVRRRIETALCFTCYKQHLTLSDPEEEAEAGSTGEGVGGAGSHILSVHLRLTAVTLRAQHGAADQTQSGSARLIASRPRTREAGRLVDQDAVIFWQVNQSV